MCNFVCQKLKFFCPEQKITQTFRDEHKPNRVCWNHFQCPIDLLAVDDDEFSFHLVLVQKYIAYPPYEKYTIYMYYTWISGPLENLPAKKEKKENSFNILGSW